jgi:iron-sulfur cluster repair protein YtfE (RIC family)
VQDPRSHLYRSIHKAVRALLAELCALASATDFSAAEELEQLRVRVKRDFGMLSGHAHHEEEYVHPLLEQHRPNIARMLNAAHDDQHEQMPTLERCLAAIDPSAADAVERGAAFCLGLSRYMADQLEHMADEEQIAMPALYEAIDEARLIAVHDALVASVPPEEMMGWLVYMIPAVSAPERAGMLMGMRLGAPPEAFAAVLEIARTSLEPRLFADLSRRLGLDVERAA